MTTIKVQRPIATNDPDERWLFYDEGRAIQVQRKPTDEERKAMDNDYKMFVVYDENGLKRIKDQSW